MPWNTITHMEEIIRFVLIAQSDRFSVTDLCEQFGISRKTGYMSAAGRNSIRMGGLKLTSSSGGFLPELH